jgi:DNA-binding NarL/FixJ family response regulator
MRTTIAEPIATSISNQPLPPAVAAGVGVLVAYDDAWLRSRMGHLLENEPGVRLAWVVESDEEATRMAKHEPVDVAVIGHRPRSLSGLRLCRELKRRDTPPAVMICSAYPDAVLAACCVVAGADALVSMYDCDAELSGALHRVAAGARLLPGIPPRVGAMLHDRLDPAENAIFSLLLAGIRASDVATALRLSQVELESRRSALLDKLERLPPTSGMRY